MNPHIPDDRTESHDPPEDGPQEPPQDQAAINAAAWADPVNWSGPSWTAVYFSKHDTRTWVPKAVPGMGWTINLGQPAGAAWLFAILLGIPLLLTLTFLVVLIAIT